MKNGCIRKARRIFRPTFQKVTVQNEISIHSMVNKLKRRVSLLYQKESDQNVECSLKRNWMELVLDLNIPLETPSDALRRRLGFQKLEHYLP
jgi:hypothetical protein